MNMKIPDSEMRETKEILQKMDQNDELDKFINKTQIEPARKLDFNEELKSYDFIIPELPFG